MSINCEISYEKNLIEFSIKGEDLVFQISKRLAFLAYNCSKSSESNIDEIFKSINGDTLYIKYIEESIWKIYDVAENMEKIHEEYKKIEIIFNKFTIEEMEEIDRLSEEHNLHQLEYVETHCILIIDSKSHVIHASEKEMNEIIAERLGYYWFRQNIEFNEFEYENRINAEFAEFAENICVKYKDYDYMEHKDEIIKIRTRLFESLNYTESELDRIEMFSDTDPLAFHKSCHSCGKNVKHLNGFCNKRCHEYFIDYGYQCNWLNNCPVCPISKN